MAHEIIDITRYLRRGPESEMPAGTMALWGAQGERSRFALPLWRIVRLAEAERGAILWGETEGDPTPRPFVVLDLNRDPVRLDFADDAITYCAGTEAPALHDLEDRGLLVNLGAKGDKTWCLLADGGSRRIAPLEARQREDILFLAGECAGLLFLRELAGEVAGTDDEQ